MMDGWTTRWTHRSRAGGLPDARARAPRASPSSASPGRVLSSCSSPFSPREASASRRAASSSSSSRRRRRRRRRRDRRAFEATAARRHRGRPRRAIASSSARTGTRTRCERLRRSLRAMTASERRRRRRRRRRGGVWKTERFSETPTGTGGLFSLVVVRSRAARFSRHHCDAAPGRAPARGRGGRARARRVHHRLPRPRSPRSVRPSRPPRPRGLRAADARGDDDVHLARRVHRERLVARPPDARRRRKRRRRARRDRPRRDLRRRLRGRRRRGGVPEHAPGRAMGPRGRARVYRLAAARGESERGSIALRRAPSRGRRRRVVVVVVVVVAAARGREGRVDAAARLRARRRAPGGRREGAARGCEFARDSIRDGVSGAFCPCTGPHTTAFAWCTPFLKDFLSRRVSPPTPRFQIPTL